MSQLFALLTPIGGLIISEEWMGIRKEVREKEQGEKGGEIVVSM